jgi:ribonucleoside-triphosphate reductase
MAVDTPEALSDFNYELPTLYQQVTHQTKYARWNEDKNRRETWVETVDRYMDFIQEHLTENFHPLSNEDFEACRKAILRLDVLPSMRALMTAGPALKRDNAAAYNCAYLVINRPHAFDEALYLLCCGTGVGFSVERQYIKQLPEIAEEFFQSETTIVVGDSKIGWAKAFRELVGMLYGGQIPKIDTSKVRSCWRTPEDLWRSSFRPWPT